MIFKKNNKQAWVLFLFFLLMQQVVYPVGTSFVYNLRIGATTSLVGSQEARTRPFQVAGLYISQTRFKHESNHKHYLNGPLFSFIYAPGPYYARVDFAFAKIADWNSNTLVFSDIEPDDLLFTAGYTFSISEKLNVSLSGLVGVPLHQEESLRHLQFGYAHKGLGAQVDASLRYTESGMHRIHFAYRYVHFMPRTAFNTAGERFCYRIGDIIDVVAIHNSTWGKHTLDVGYNAFFSINPHISPFVESVIQGDTYSRNFFFGTYIYAIRPQLSGIIGLSYGYDKQHRLLNNKALLTVWMGLSGRF